MLTIKENDLVVSEDFTGLLRVVRVMKKRIEVLYLNPQSMGVICGSSMLIRKVRLATKQEAELGYKL